MRARPDEPLALWCEARIYGCKGRAVHRHHVLRRSQGGGDEASNTMDLCDHCHIHIHSNPAQSYVLGFLRHRSSNPPASPNLLAGEGEAADRGMTRPAEVAPLGGSDVEVGW